MNVYDEMTMPKLGELAKELGVYPEEGSGNKGRIQKKDLLNALKVGASAVVDVVEEALTSQETYQFDTQYEVVKPFNNYKVGAMIINVSRNLGLELVESGSIKKIPGRPYGSNPKAPFKLLKRRSPKN